MTTDLPSVEEELERKAMDELSRILHHYETSRITHREMNLMLDTLWACVSGLAGEDWREMIEEARMVEDNQVPTWYHAIRLEPLSVVTLHRDDESLEVTFRDAKGDVRRKHYDFSADVFPARKAWNFMKVSIKELTNKGFTSLCQ